MLYKKNSTPKLDENLFKQPTSEYRGAPFWAWNCKLDREELLRQIHCLYDMGFGGFHIHPRTGMSTKYLSEEFMSLVRACAEEGEKCGMLTWLYDEDRWPSGFAGGLVTQNIKNRQKFIRFTVKESACNKHNAEIIACFDIVLDEEGYLERYEMISTDAVAVGQKWFVYMETQKPSGRFNNQTYVDVMSKNAISDFIDITYEGYKRAVGDKFGTVINTIFTDEPRLADKGNKINSFDLEDVILPWTTDFDKTYKETYGSDIISKLPELVWEIRNVSVSRYNYHNHICQRLVTAFHDQCGVWCQENGLMFTGHVLGEGSLFEQTKYPGEIMRLYRSFDIPGIDMLCNAYEYAAAKQCQSIVHQYNREAMLSELYGVTGWTFDFRGHKLQGDWQAALGVSVRVPHLSWVSMKGAAKRDYPATISYQSPWYTKYSYIENHFARVNTVLTRGKPVVKVGIIHPVESMWLYFGARDLTSEKCNEIDYNFSRIIERMLFSTIDFDFISEALLPDLYNASDDKMLSVGSMEYSAIIVPDMHTIRKSTIDILTEFKNKGGKLIFIGECPRYVDGILSDMVLELFNSSLRFEKVSYKLLESLKEEREISISDERGNATDNLLYNQRIDNGITYLFVAHGRDDKNPDIAKAQNIKIEVKGKYKVELLDTVNGEILQIPHYTDNGKTCIPYVLYNADSIMLRLTPEERSFFECSKESIVPDYSIDFRGKTAYKRTEPNVVLLDMAQWSKDGINFNEKEQLLRIDSKLRNELNYPSASGMDVQPYLIDEDEVKDFIYLRFEFFSEIQTDCSLAFEEVEEVIFNADKVEVIKDGFYADKSIFTMVLPKTKIGLNELVLKVPFGKRTGLENFMILGDFDVELSGCEMTIKKPSDMISFGSVIKQGMPFYSGNIVYETKIYTSECDIVVNCGQYRGAFVEVSVDDMKAVPVALAPYTASFSGLQKGEHTVRFTLYGNRQNTFGPLHNCNPKYKWIGPNAWYTSGNEWSYDYSLADIGIITSPKIDVIESKEKSYYGI